jgi:hypothetical protein
MIKNAPINPQQTPTMAKNGSSSGSNALIGNVVW